MDDAIKKVIKIAGIISLIAMIGVIAVTAYAASFSVMIADDFFFAADTGRRVDTFQYLSACWNHMVYEYLNWQGAYFSELANSMFNPVNSGGFAALGVIMVINVILSYGAFFSLILAGMHKMFAKELSVKLIILGLSLFALAEYEVFAEVFFWYTGAMAVTVPFSLALMALAAMIMSDENKGWIVISCILGFLSAGGSLAVGGTLCYFALVIILYRSIRDKSICWKKAIPFGAFFAGSLVNALAPGNFVRQGVESSSHVSLVETFKNVWTVFIGEIEWLFKSNNFGAIICLFILCGAFLAGAIRLDKKAWLISGLFALLTPAVTIFPVVLGYRVPWIPNRCRLITTMMFIICLGNMALLIGDTLGDTLKKNKNLCIVVLAVLAVVITFTSDLSPRSYRTVRVFKGLYDHTYQDNYNATRDLMDYLKDHQGEDLVVDVPTYPEIVEYYYSFYLLDTEDDRINRAVSWTYGLNSIKSSREYGE